MRTSSKAGSRLFQFRKGDHIVVDQGHDPVHDFAGGPERRKKDSAEKKNERMDLAEFS